MAARLEIQFGGLKGATAELEAKDLFMSLRIPTDSKSTLRATPRLLGLLLITLIYGANLSGQTVQPGAVARLVSTSAETARPRRVAAEKPAIGGPASLLLEQANSIERRAFEQTNAVRLQHGLRPFVWDGQLVQLARTHSENMARLGFFSHSTPVGLRLKDRVRSAGISYQVIAENIAYNMGYDDPGAFAVERWMISPGHRANILHAGFTSMAVGTFVAADGSVFLTQTFITR